MSGETNYQSAEYTEHEIETLEERIGTTADGEEKYELAQRNIERFASRLGLSKDFSKRAEEIYRKTIRTDLVNNLSISQIVSASIYITCRERQIPRALVEIEAISFSVHKQIASAYNQIRDEFDYTLEIISPKKFFERYIVDIGAPEEIRQIGEVTLKKIQNDRYIESPPPNLAAGSLYYASKKSSKKVSKSKISNITKISQANIQQMSKRIQISIEYEHYEKINHRSLERFCKSLLVSNDTRETAIVTLRVTENPYQGFQAGSSYAAGILCYAIEQSNSNISITQLSKTVGFSVDRLEELKMDIAEQLDG